MSICGYAPDLGVRLMQQLSSPMNNYLRSQPMPFPMCQEVRLYVRIYRRHWCMSLLASPRRLALMATEFVPTLFLTPHTTGKHRSQNHVVSRH